MRKRVGAVVMIALVFWLAAGGIFSAVAQPALDSRGINAIVSDVVRAREQRDADHLYDLLVPDERDLIPRGAFAIWSAGIASIPSGTPTLGDISEGTWISALTGEEYDAVFVEYTVDVTSGQRIENQSEELVLWRDGQSWRWFFDGGRRDVNQVTDATAWSVAYESPYRTDMFRQLDLFWAQVFADHGLDYRPPADMIGVHVEPIQTGCGREDDIEQMAVYYCTLDETIYYDPDFRDLLTSKIGEYAWEHVIAHEWGHHVQKLLGFYTSRDPELQGGQYTIEHELQADCLSGIFDQDAYARGVIDDGDLDMAMTITELAADATGTSWDDQSAHGTGMQRQQSYQLGFTDGFIGCHVFFDEISGEQ